MVNTVMSVFKAEIVSDNIELTCAFMPSCPPSSILHCDWHRAAQVLINLISNAIKFTRDRPVRSIHVEVDLHSADTTNPDCHVLAFGVRDTGIGMNQAEMAKLFVPFGQANVRTYRY